MAEHNQTGTTGEELAASFLEKKGYSVLEKNWRFGHEEIDILASKDSTLVVAEVKARKSNFFGEPEEFVTRQKQKHLIKAANAYIEKNNLQTIGRDRYLSPKYPHWKVTSHQRRQLYHQ